MKIEGVLLDFNGTLFFDSHYHDLAWKQMSKEIRGYEMSDEELCNHMHGKNNENIINYLHGKTMDQKKNKQYSLRKEEIYRELCLAHPQDFHLAKGVETFLTTLVKKKIPFTIASASIKENIDFFVEQFHLDQYFDPSLIVYDDGRFPGKVEMFMEAARLLHVNAQNCMIIEDSVSGIKFAHDVHAACIVGIDSSNDPQKFEQFPYLRCVLKDFEDFPWKLLL